MSEHEPTPQEKMEELDKELKRVQRAKEKAIEKQDFHLAADLRSEESVISTKQWELRQSLLETNTIESNHPSVSERLCYLEARVDELERRFKQ